MATPFIHSAATPIMEYLLDVSHNKPTTDVELLLVTESVGIVEVLVRRKIVSVRQTNEENSKCEAN